MRSPVKNVVGALPLAVVLATLAATSVAPRRLPAQQQLSGIVRDARDSSAVAGAIVILLSANGEKLGGTLAGDDGRYVLRVPAPGRYALRVDLVGFRSVNVPPFEIAGQSDATRDLTVALERATLPAVTVTTSSRCDRVTGESGDAARLWAEARKALEATRLAQHERRFPVTLQRFEQVVSLPDSVVRSTKRSTEAGVTENPFVSLPPDSIQRVGYRVREDGEELFYAPDAEVLLSDPFVEDHCFQSRRATAGGGLGTAVGLSFTPSRTRSRTDVAGVLWLDSATAELRSLEFRYEPAPPGGMAGGSVEFGRLPSGGFGVRRWRIWMPAERVATRRRRPDGSYAFTADTVVTSIREQGGEVVTALGGRGAMASGRLARLHVSVFDSTRQVPFANATVTVEGTGSSAVTGSDGFATLDSIAEEGTYQVRFWHPRLDSLGLGMVRAAVRLTRAATVTLALATPSAATMARALCAEAPADSVRVVRGIARSALDGSPAASAMVDVVWFDADGRVRRRATQTSDDGRFAACVAAPAVFYVSAIRDGDVVTPVQVSASARGVTVVALRLTAREGLASADSGAVLSLGSDPVADAPRGVSTIAGVVLGAYDEGVRNLRATIDGREAVIRTDSSGAFTLPNVAPGLHALALRAIGYAPARVRFRADSSTRIGLYVRLPRASTTIAEVRVSGERAKAGLDWTRGFDTRRRRAAGGTFMSRADIERRGGQSLVDLLTGQPGVVVTPDRGGYRFYSRLSGGRIGAGVPTSNTQSGDLATPVELPPGQTEECEFRFLVDGQDYGTSRDALVGGLVLQIRAADIEAMEIYPGGASIPLEFGGSNARCGVIVVWTRSRLGPSQR